MTRIIQVPTLFSCLSIVVKVISVLDMPAIDTVAKLTLDLLRAQDVIPKDDDAQPRFDPGEVIVISDSEDDGAGKVGSRIFYWMQRHSF